MQNSNINFGGNHPPYRSALVKTLDWSVETLGRECFIWAVHSFIQNRVTSENLTDAISGCCELTIFKFNI